MTCIEIRPCLFIENCLKCLIYCEVLIGFNYKYSGGHNLRTVLKWACSIKMNCGCLTAGKDLCCLN